MLIKTPEGWKLAEHTVIYSENGEQKEKIVGEEGTDWWVDYTEKWNLDIVEFTELNYTPEQLVRLEEVQGIKTHHGAVENYVLNGEITDVEPFKVLKLEKENASLKVAGQIVTRQLVRDGALTAKELTDIAILYPPWEAGINYTVGDICVYGGALYEVIQAHTSQSDWTPDKVPALFKSTLPEGIIGEWKQPAGAHDAYNKGDKVLFNGKTYESLIDANVWSPSAYPQGWKLIG